jgi:hypothetical protein
LNLQGYAHYLPQSERPIHLYSDTKLPGWLSKLPLNESFVHHNRTRFLPPAGHQEHELSLSTPAASDAETILPGALRVTRWGQWKWPLVMSTPERAILEMIDELPHEETFHLVGVTMEGLVNVSPRRMPELREDTTSVKVKRLFLFFADRHGHRWLNRIEREKINLGTGKRMLV